MAAVAVVGGGLAGLTTANRLKQRGIRVVVYEAGDRPGGVILTQRDDDYLADLGPNSLATPTPDVHSLLAHLGLESSLVPASPAARKRFVVKRNKLVPLPMSPSEILTTRLLSQTAKLAVFGEPLVEQNDSPMEESIAGFVRRRFSQEVVDYVANPYVAGIYAGDPEQLSVRHALPRLYGLERSHGSVLKAFMGNVRDKKKRKKAGDPEPPPPLVSFRDGMAQLPQALARELHAEMRLRSRVTSLRVGEKGWTVAAAFQPSELYDGVVLTAPTHRIDEMDLDFPVGDRLKTLGSITYPAVTVVALGFRREDVAHPLDGFGFLVPEVERRNVLGCIFSSTLFPGRAPEGHVMLTSFVGGVRNPDLANADEHTISARVLDDLRLLLGVKGEPTFRAFQLWSNAIPQYDLTYSRFKEIMEEAERRNPALALAGSFREGVSVGDVIAGGEAAAERLADHLAEASVAG
jgi:protoporphyrinogen/coproporphyrinogen III oxidase